jgi:nucleotide-binding universal stress UspA family protein
MSYRRIMVPLDGSDFAVQSLPVAEELARRSGAELVLVGVHPGLPPGPTGRVPEPLARADREVAEAERQALEREAERLRGEGIEAQAELEEGPVVDTLCARARESADLVVMATHGRGRLTRFWLGSTADGMVRQCSVPILLVRPEGDGDAGTPAVEIRDLLLPLDGSRVAESVLAPATELARVLGARVTLLQVVVPVMNPGFGVSDFPEGVDQALVEPMESEAEEYVADVADRLAEEGLEVETRVIRYPDAAAAILESAEELGTDLVAMATHGRGGVRRLLLGSVADKVIRAGETPVLVVRPEDA